MKTLQQFLKEELKFIMVGPYPIPVNIMREGKEEVKKYILEQKKKQKLMDEK